MNQGPPPPFFQGGQMPPFHPGGMPPPPHGMMMPPGMQFGPPMGMPPGAPPFPMGMPPPPMMMQKPPRDTSKYSKPPADLGTPNRTIYVRNLNEKISLVEVKKSLRNLFGQYGEVIDILASKNIRMRGQAFVIFNDLESAKKALKIQGFPLFNKPMVVMYARDDSAAVVKLDGKLDEWRVAHKEKKIKNEEIFEEVAKKALENGLAGQERRKASGLPFGFQMPSFQPIPDEMLPPNKILFVQNIPAEATEEMIASLFKKFIGFREVRTVPGKNDIAFVEFNTEFESVLAKDSLNGAQIIPDHLIKVTFARK